MLLNQYGLRANKKLGQNFLINQEIIDEIIKKSQITKEDTVLEIGPGLGSLTKALMQNAKRVIAVELDENMVNILNNRFNNENLEIINEDILKVNLNEITDKYGKIKVVANLPYYITTPIVMKLLEEEYNIESITVMVQKEVGERLCAEPGSRDFGAVTIGVNFYSKAKIIIDVPKDNFMPIPEVDSCVIKLEILKEPPVILKDKKRFFRLVKAAFSQRRKTINNSLASGEFSKENVLTALTKLGIDAKLRAEDLSIQDFANITNELIGG
ncbi:MAG: 16S rRNA (adenine(1518)-N(6)/adenine(1519)-N(6))-dimethyltransferase RsmA [Clostridia bacterium]|nr:16S rRNA (adenine(1518)-N(6)/adenine(1519)-N(6))-dimethyltransferase RsmA [Clostridia bacterium]